MFAQIIKGKASDEAGLRKQNQKWVEELKPGSSGFLGSTGGIATDGTFVTIARFESEEAARKNSDRPEQGEWWKETEQYLEPGSTFVDSTEVDEFLGGGSNDAGFVQVMQGSVSDKEKAKEMGQQMEPMLRENRPDVLGGMVVWHPGGSEFTQVMYFKSEAEARERESASDNSGPPEEFGKLFSNMTYIDLKEPELI
ncbi:MAG: hypothetical protein QOH26_1336 [Actinomycetota bacterium]|nr:hypothetical protein [Actinomycetota bacterium]